MVFILMIFCIVLGVLFIFEGFKEVSCGGDFVFYRNKIFVGKMVFVIKFGLVMIIRCVKVVELRFY